MGSKVKFGHLSDISRSQISKKTWAARKRGKGKGTCAFCHKKIFAGGVRYSGKKWHKTCLAARMMGFTLKQIGKANPRRARTAAEYYPGIRALNPFLPEPSNVHIPAMAYNPLFPYYPAFVMPTQAFNPTAPMPPNVRIPAMAYNPRPPAGWFAQMIAHMRAEYPGATYNQLKQIVGGIWAKYSPTVKEAILEKYD